VRFGIANVARTILSSARQIFARGQQLPAARCYYALAYFRKRDLSSATRSPPELVKHPVLLTAYQIALEDYNAAILSLDRARGAPTARSCGNFLTAVIILGGVVALIIRFSRHETPGAPWIISAAEKTSSVPSGERTRTSPSENAPPYFMLYQEG
jgi:hypothetical protein